MSGDDINLCRYVLENNKEGKEDLLIGTFLIDINGFIDVNELYVTINKL